MYYSDDPVRDADRYARHCANQRLEEIRDEISQLESDLEDDDKYFEWFKNYGCEYDEVYKLYEKYINDQIKELEEEAEDCRW